MRGIGTDVGSGSGTVGVQFRRFDTSCTDSRTAHSSANNSTHNSAYSSGPSSAHSSGPSSAHSSGPSSGSRMDKHSVEKDRVSRLTSSSTMPKHSALPLRPTSSSSVPSSSSAALLLSHLSARRSTSLPPRAPSLPLPPPPLPSKNYRHGSFKAKRMLQAAEGIIADELKTQLKRKDTR